MMNRFTQKAQNTLNNSQRFAHELGHTYIGSEHLLLALACEEESVAAKLLSECGLTVDALRTEIRNLVGEGSSGKVSPADMTPRTKRILQHSAMESARLGQSYIGTEHLLLALLAEQDCVAVKLLENLNVSRSVLLEKLSAFFGTKHTSEDTASREGGRVKSSKNTQATLSNAPTLSQYGRDLTAMAKEGRIDPIIGRDK